LTKIVTRIIFAAIITMLCGPLLSASENRPSIVPPDQMISDFDARLALAKILSYNDNTLAESLREYTFLLEQQPDNPEVWLDMAKILMRKNRYQDALSYFNYVLSKKPDDYETLSSIGDAYLYTNRLKDAITFYNKALAVNPSSFEMQKKLALALSWDGSDEKALPLLLDIHRKNPENKETTVELSRLYTRKMQQQKALSLLYALRARYPGDPDILVEMAGIEASLGHAVKCRQLYIDALKMSNNNENILLRYADAMNMWGDFYKIEKIYKDHLRAHPGSTDIMLKLAWSLVSSERYEEAEGMYLILLLNNPDMTEALLDMAKLKLMEKDFAGALSFSDKFLVKKPGKFEALSLKAEALSYLKNYEDASNTYDEIIKRTDKKEKRAEALLGRGKMYLKQKDQKKAREYFEKAYEVDKENVKAQFYYTGIEHVTSRDFVDKILGKEAASPGRLKEWAELYALQGFNKEAILFYRAAIIKDPEFFPASIGLAQMYAIDHQYKNSIELLELLNANLPDASKIMIWQARALAWSKKYTESIEAYKSVRQINRKDPVPRKEMARVAVWGKMIDDADAFYKEIYTPPVDKELLKILTPAIRKIKNEHLLEALKRLDKISGEDSVYKGYEKFSGDFDAYRQALPDNQRIQVETVLLELLPAYRIQKDAFLENRSKRFAWHKKFIHALESYEELIDFSPGNQEAIFDYAQVECSLGLCNREAKTYNTLLNIDPLHSLAGLALERQKIRSSPFLQSNYTYWMEDGRGDLSQISRNRFDLTLNIPLFCQYYAGVTGHRWLENPWYNHKTYAADGYSLFLGGIINPFIKGEMKWTYKKYSDSEISPRNTGHAFLWFNLKDYAHLGGGYERADEIYNYFGIQQGTQSDSWWMGISSDITRKLEINGKARFINYNDSNSGQQHQLSAGYAVTDHPRIFKVSMSGEYRNTQHENVSIYRGSNLINIIHPYWTPQNYTGTGITFEWYHDYSKLFFCGNELRFYDIKVSFGTDTENNPSAKIEAELYHQFYNHWTIGIKGMLNSSPQWNANGLWATLKYQF
jgi:tetratricopeptide (TPR) repeat protein